MKRLHTIFMIFASVIAMAGTPKSVTVPADDSRIRYVGRTEVKEGAVSYDWSGVTAIVCFEGKSLVMECSDSKGDWFNIWIDKVPTAKEDTKLSISGEQRIVLADGLGKGPHTLYMQKRTEGEQGRLTIKSFTASDFKAAPAPKERRIEFIGDSYTCGFGTEGASAYDPFLPETENTNLTYAAILGRFFDADITTVCHSGRGIIRNYGDAEEGYTMVDRYDQTFDEYREGPIWDPSSFTPDIVVIYLGTNDFSCYKQPWIGPWSTKYAELLAKIRRNYGIEIPILCVASDVDPEMGHYVEQAVARSGDGNAHWAVILKDTHNTDSDLGSGYHPNYSGQRKVASVMAPFISTLTGWDFPTRTLE